jgi:CheY-like chemotaxis protein
MESETILVVDDDPAALEFCCTVLLQNGYQVLRASSGKQALDFCRNGERFDMALVDVVMPGMNGIELLKWLETLDPNPKVALISGYSPAEVERLIGRDGSNYRIFWKPFEARMFLQMVRNVLDTPPREAAYSAHS